MEYDLKIERIKYITELNSFKNVIIGIDWVYNYKETQLSGTLEIKEPSYDNFIIFEDVNEEILIQWILDMTDIDNKHLLVKNSEESIKDENILIPEVITIDFVNIDKYTE
jgi:hypothetical protein